MIVLDASAAVDFLLETGDGEWARARLLADANAHAPHVIELEVASALRRRVLLGDAPEPRARAALADLPAIGITLYRTTALLGRIWQLRTTLTPHDAAYVALAEALDAPLVTTDRRLARSTGHAAAIETPPA